MKSVSSPTFFKKAFSDGPKEAMLTPRQKTVKKHSPVNKRRWFLLLIVLSKLSEQV